jgi:hypothetical protein
MNVSIDRLLIAYRKTKYEAFRDTTCGGYGAKFLKFEEHIRHNRHNLEKLQKTLTDGEWPQDMNFLGEVTFVPKSIESPPTENTIIHHEHSDPLKQWRRRCANAKAVTEFRPVISASVEYLLISTLWILEVGHLFDDALLDCAMGNRLKRTYSTGHDVNEFAHELFTPYFGAYGKWQRTGLKTMRSELEAKRSVLAITMDLKRFYHNVDASFILNETFLRRIGISLSPNQIAFTKSLLASFNTYNREVKKLTGADSCRGLPVGLSASAIIANVLLKELDDQIQKRLTPAYYGRYVDDVFLVLRGSHETDKLADGGQIMRWLSQRVPRLVVDGEGENVGLRIKLPYAGKSDLLFAGKKQRIFQLSRESGLDLLGPIEEQIKQQSSEHRDMPELPETANQMAHRALLVASDASELADALRKADSVSLRRSGFAMLLGDAEAYSRDLPSKEWQAIRHTFFGLAHRNLLSPIGLFDFSRYYPRVLSLMVQNGDWKYASEFIRRLGNVFDLIQETSEIRDNVSPNHIPCMKNRIGRLLIETVLMDSSRGSSECVKLLEQINKTCGAEWKRQFSSRNVTETHKRLLRLDWVREPYWQHSMDAGNTKLRPRPKWLYSAFKDTLEAVSLYGELCGHSPTDYPPILFPTRKLPMYEIIRSAPALLEDKKKLSIVLKGLRAQSLSSDVFAPAFTDEAGKTIFHVSTPSRRSGAPRKTSVKIAVSNFEVSDKEWQCAAKGKPSLTLERYQRLNKLLDSVAECPEKPNYVVLPECCLPRCWERNTVMRTLGRGVSLIAGLEYRIEKTKKIVHNEALTALTTNFLGYPFWLPIIQEKTLPAYREKSELRKCKKTWSEVNCSHPVYFHNGFSFGVLICSELTDLRNRLHFQGEVDALFVPEWNQDIETFASLVEASALDVHAFIVQANNRKYGDSRIRAPMKGTHQKDILRTKGGVNDFFVIGEIEYKKLRAFQTNTPAGGGKDDVFKPVPIGFKMSSERGDL